MSHKFKTPIVLVGDPSNPLEPATKQYTDTKIGGAKGFVNHGSDGNTARPSGYGSIEWIGSVEPVNAIDGDTWIDTS